jgi:hypothetical protein
VRWRTPASSYRRHGSASSSSSGTQSFLTSLRFTGDLLGDGAAATAEIDGDSRPRVFGFGGAGQGAARVRELRARVTAVP